MEILHDFPFHLQRYVLEIAGFKFRGGEIYRPVIIPPLIAYMKFQCSTYEEQINHSHIREHITLRINLKVCQIVTLINKEPVSMAIYCFRGKYRNPHLLSKSCIDFFFPITIGHDFERQRSKGKN